MALGFSERRVSAARLLVLTEGLLSYLGEQGTTMVSESLHRMRSSCLSFLGQSRLVMLPVSHPLQSL